MQKPIVDFEELENAMLVVGDGSYVAEAWVCRGTGKVFVRSDALPEESDIPADTDDYDKYLPVPDSRKLDLGQRLAFRFVEAHFPEEYEQVRQYFRKPGAYRRFSSLLDSLGATDKWHQFRDEQTEAALREWCEDNGLELHRK